MLGGSHPGKRGKKAACLGADVGRCVWRPLSLCPRALVPHIQTHSDGLLPTPHQGLPPMRWGHGGPGDMSGSMQPGRWRGRWRRMSGGEAVMQRPRGAAVMWAVWVGGGEALPHEAPTESPATGDKEKRVVRSLAEDREDGAPAPRYLRSPGALTSASHTAPSRRYPHPTQASVPALAHHHAGPAQQGTRENSLEPQSGRHP